ncbi:tissue factor pathway inhibitor isoform X1 [Dasypus novemcinctus]|uniref:tissue factor pathway inhibitor isoform X1 n=2 Tax=Dasypus novemcinctus TaxID=9361 RepID=UPI00265E1DED|nr:tissue factor pathway inhibitor isoform X1 [Dasypus novemcinctus]XP_058156498.1 tissue factor pathway inhibitor isoform X1 [Dasypus novemcinctus]
MIHTMKKKNIFWVVICLLLTGAPALLNADSDEEEYTNITDTKLPALKLKHTFCAMKADNGPCRAMITRFFFNIHTQQCEDFIYGGCEGNQNQFESLEECKEKCIIDYPKEISKVKLQKEKPEFCFLEEDAGICRGYITRYFYNNQSKQCERFKYGGCLGNPNNFESLEECEKICKATLDDFQVDDSRTQHDAVKNNTLTSQTTNVSRLWEYHGPSWCQGPADRGLCHANINRYYFNSIIGKCRPFKYSGCGGNENNFTSKKACLKTCKKGFTKRISKGLIKNKQK